MNLNIYEFRVGGEKECICAPTIIEAMLFYKGLNDLELYDFKYGDDIVLIPREEWKNHFIRDVENPDENGVYPIVATFEEIMKGQTRTDIISTTAW